MAVLVAAIRLFCGKNVDPRVKPTGGGFFLFFNYHL